MPLIGALVVKEFQTWLRGRLTFAAFTLLVLLLPLLVFLLEMLILAPDANAAPALFSTTSTTSTNLLVANRAIFLFGAVGLCVILAAAVVAPAGSASAFATERERGTLDLLLLQGPGPARIVLGKVLAALMFSLLLLAVGVPFFAPAWSFGGVQPDQVIALITILCTVTLFFCALGVFFGAILKGALQAALFAQGVALFIVFGTLGLHMAFFILGSNDTLRPLLWLSPFLALLSSGGTATDAFARGAPAAYRGVLSLPAQSWAPGLLCPPGSLAAWPGPLWRYCSSSARRFNRANPPHERQARPITMLSPAATYHAELREQLGTVGRALSVQRGLLWLARGLAGGTILALGLVVWAWARDAVATLPILLLVGVPLVLSMLTAAGSLFIRHTRVSWRVASTTPRDFKSGRQPRSSWAHAVKNFRLPWHRCATPSST